MSGEHWNIQVSIQKVVEPQPVLEKGTYQVKLPGGAVQMTDRKVYKVCEVAVSADSEEEAYAKAARIMDANRLVRHRHGASCHGPVGELVCDLDGLTN